MISRKHDVRLSAIPAVATILAALGLAYLQWNYDHINFWEGLPVEGDIAGTFCEHSEMDRLIREKVNTWSGLPYIFFGVWIFITGINDYKNPFKLNLIVRYPVYSILAGLMLIYLFFGSVFFHLSLIRDAEHMDLSAVFGLMTFPFIYNSHRIYNLKKHGATGHSSGRVTSAFIIFYLTVFIAMTVFKWYIDSLLAVPILIVLAGVTVFYVEYRQPGSSNSALLFTAAITIALAIIAIILDFNKIFCYPHSLFQLHALWHVLAAVSFFTLYLYFRSENMNESHSYQGGE